MFKITKTISLLAVVLAPLATQADVLTVVVQGITESAGNVRIAILDSESAFKDDGEPVATAVIKAVAPSVTHIADLPAGQYAIRLMHDVDGDEKLKRNLVGMPKEPYGFSNNVRGKFGPPKWKDAAFQFEGDSTMTIDLVH